MTLMPAIPGTSRFRSCCLPCKIAPKKPRNNSGSRKLKNAALGLRQYRLERRARARCSSAASLSGRRLSSIGREFEVHVLEARARHVQLPQALAARQRFARELVQQRRWLLGPVL